MTPWALATVGAVACAHQPVPNDQIAQSMAAVRGAEEVGAAEVPEAALHMRLAEEQITRAKQLVEDEENRRAEDTALRAKQDAELAIALVHEHSSKRKLEGLAERRAAGGEATVAQPAQGESQ